MVSHSYRTVLCSLSGAIVLSLPKHQGTLTKPKRLSQVDLVEPKAATLHANWISRQQPLSYSASLGVLWCTTGFKVLMHSNLNSYQNFFLTRYRFIHLSLPVAKLQKYVMIYSQCTYVTWQKYSLSKQGVWKALKWSFRRAETSNAAKCIDLRKKDF